MHASALWDSLLAVSLVTYLIGDDMTVLTVMKLKVITYSHT